MAKRPLGARAHARTFGALVRWRALARIPPGRAEATVIHPSTRWFLTLVLLDATSVEQRLCPESDGSLPGAPREAAAPRVHATCHDRIGIKPAANSA